MGWTYSHKRRGQPIKEFFQESGMFKGINGHEFKLLKMRVVNLRECYFAVWHKGPEGKAEVFGGVILLQYASKSYHNFGYKEIEESMGPYQCNCPEDILDLLSETESEYALKWREQCRENAKKNKHKRKLKDGTLIRLDHELKFTNGDREQAFIYRKIGRKTRFENPRSGQMYKITGFNKMNFKIITDAVESIREDK